MNSNMKDKEGQPTKSHSLSPHVALEKRQQSKKMPHGGARSPATLASAVLKTTTQDHGLEQTEPSFLIIYIRTVKPEKGMPVQA